ncbi:flagellar protein FliT [Pseudomonas sp. JM0905a]|uniref:flagellar protein FliT n=1 Tax=Pseudomonas sp. JM0905a TaxID=2772484 RepID=UPI001685C712|nr:flagellar protein FliT [Pseudomonas sp. JM0905a]MBD2837635.1 flagellar protein FliT [Pseudomonas sp. JM0905a]
MTKSVQLLEAAGAMLRDALNRRDWEAIGVLDQQCRQAIDEAMDEVPVDEALLRTRMEDLLALYRELVECCRNEQQRIAGELLQLNQAKQGAKVYQLFG